MKSGLILIMLMLAALPARAELLENTSNEAVMVTAPNGYPVNIRPKTVAQVPNDVLSVPEVRRLMAQGTLRRYKGRPENVQLTEAYCVSDEYPDDASYCFLDMAVQEADPHYCSALTTWSSVKECLYYVDRERKLTEKDCNYFDPGSAIRTQCVEYVKSGIPSKPGQSYEASLRLSNG